MATLSLSSGTAIDEIADRIYRISTPLEIPGGGGFSFNQFLIDDDEPLLFHTGLRRLFPVVREAVERIMPVGRLRYVGFSHFEADECGALNQFLAAAPRAEPLCGQIAAMVSVSDYADRPPRALDDGETISLGQHKVSWLDTPHLPHAWECGFLMECTSATLLCGDLFTQGGSHPAPLTEGDILEPSEAFRRKMDYFSHTRNARAMLERLAALQPTTLACMHGSAWRGDGAALLRALADSVERDQPGVS
ncbi:MBL fold metallo-hydrolase [Cupriavidus consociatus]|uniref:MBL fold metallo-hydrolase n=1 Tax=Cupriavidus consociatus TaxID=2821357 RepID=UPI001AE541AF|nr:MULTISPECIES: MBL fold metallo-hydrolase [unclassified Cupriavidus]MBP0618876.1 MBL fold metallo-hydrolase [Cupriavidus sp. LEh25]MDK2655519.1 MBL fold metallo-hydrolase [Cupriavidus sp. LEh21]